MFSQLHIFFQEQSLCSCTCLAEKTWSEAKYVEQSNPKLAETSQTTTKEYFA